MTSSAPHLNRSVALLALAIGCGLLATAAYSGVGFVRGGAVGGVMVDAEGVLTNPTTTDLRDLQQAWLAGMDNIQADLDDPAELRFVSLKGLEAAIARHRKELKPLPDEVLFLAGLQRVQYVLVYPDKNDIVLAGPAEGWRIDSLGNPVGATSNRPVLMLEDLILALRTADQSAETGISCSIDPTPAGLQRSAELQRQFRPGMSPEAAAAQLEKALGPQIITVQGVPDTSHFARVMVAADFRMKRLAMNFEPAPIDGLPSYLELARNSTHPANMLPRWWLAPHYEALHRDPAGLAWELRGQGVKCLTEQDMVTAGGQIEHTGKTEPIAQQWAETFTERFDELAREDSTFGQLRNLMDLAVVAALLHKENLISQAGLTMPRLMEEEVLASYNAPRQVASQASFLKRRRGWLISTSGGVQMDPWYIADQVEVAEPLADTRSSAEQVSSETWWWNATE
jgi:hypothetical protein